jgi:hypothetical protein
MTNDGIVQVAGLDDLMATKLKVILQRIEAKDYQDIAAMIRAGADLSRGLAGARALYGTVFQPNESLKALAYFEGGDLHRLTSDERRLLIQAAASVRALPDVEIQADALAMPCSDCRLQRVGKSTIIANSKDCNPAEDFRTGAS